MPESFPLSPLAAALSRSLAATGFLGFGFLGPSALSAVRSRVDASVCAAYGLDSARGALLAALPYGPGPAAPTEADGPPPHARIAPFAAANRYATLVRLLRAVALEAGAELGLARPLAALRVFVNSRLPEKPMAALAGLGFLGRSSLLVHRVYGPSCLLGGMLLPDDPFAGAVEPVAEPAALVPGALCGACRACVDACPTGALAGPAGEGGSPSGLDRASCIQHWTTEPGPVPGRVAAAWGRRLYGCDECVRACPHSAGAADAGFASPLPAEDRPGAFVSIPELVSLDEPALAARFRGSALGMKRFQPGLWRRNAALCLDASDTDARID